MGGLTSSVGDLFGGAANNAGFTAAGTNIVQPTTAAQAQTAYGTAQSGLNQQQALVNALQNQNGIGNQSSVFNQLQGVANGTGPNPALAQLQQATGQNVQNQAALMAGQRGASANPALLAREAAQQGAATQQQAVGQGATLAANQQLNALSGLGNLATQQVAQQQQAVSGLNQAAQNEQGTLLGGLNAQNQSNVSLTSNQNNANAALAQTNANNTAKAIGGLSSGLSGGVVALAKGGSVPPNPKIAAVSASHRYPPHLRDMAILYHPEHMQAFAKGYADGGSVSQGPSTWQKFQNSPLGKLGSTLGFYNAPESPPASSPQTVASSQAAPAQTTAQKLSASPIGQLASSIGSLFADGGDVGSPQAIANSAPDIGQSNKGGPNPASLALLASQGGNIPGKAPFKGDTPKNDEVPAMLTKGEFVIPKSVMESENPAAGAAKMIAEYQKKNGKGSDNKKDLGDFKSALQRAVKERKSK